MTHRKNNLLKFTATALCAVVAFFAVTVQSANAGALLSPNAQSPQTLKVGPGPHSDYKTIQAAINDAGHGDTILIQNATYKENIYIIGKSLTLEGGYNYDFTSRNQPNTIIDGSDSLCALPTVSVNYNPICPAGFGAAFVPPTSPDAVHVTLDGLHIRGGSDSGMVVNAPQDSVITITNNTIHENLASDEDAAGGGARIRLDDRATLIMTGNLFSHNAAASPAEGDGQGGGVWVYGEQLDLDGGRSISNTVVIVDNEIHSNLADEAGGIYVGLGRLAHVEINDNRFFANGFHGDLNDPDFIAEHAGGMFLRLGNNSSGSFSNNAIFQNAALEAAGASIILDDNTRLRFDGNEITNNTGLDGIGGLKLAAKRNVRLEGETLTVNNNVGDEIGGAWLELTNNSYLTLTQQLDASFNVVEADGDSAGVAFQVDNNSHVYLAQLHTVGNACDACAGGGFAVEGMYNHSSIEIGNAIVLSNTLGGGGVGGGGYINFASSSSFILHEGRFEENVAATGGGLYVAPTLFGTRLQLSNTDFISNMAETGGGLYLTDARLGVSVNLEDSRFISNTASIGGGLFIAGSYAAQCAEARFNRNQFIGNYAAGGGGGGIMSVGTFVDGCAAEFKDNIFQSNYTGLAGTGGAASFTSLTLLGGGQITFTGNEFIDNHSGAGGGALSINGIAMNGGGLLTMTHNRFVGNRTGIGGPGGAIFAAGLATGSTVLFTHNEVISNTSGVMGGGLYLGQLALGGSTIRFENNTISRNVISDMGIVSVEAADIGVADIGGMGGGVYIEGISSGDLVRFTGNVITGNAASLAGGGLYWGTVADGSYLNLDDNTISQNTVAGQGAACFFSNLVGFGATVNFRRNTIAQNASNLEAGGCYFRGFDRGATLNMYDNQFVGNRAGVNVGALTLWEVYGGTTLDIQRNTFSDNRAGYMENTPTGGYFASIAVYSQGGGSRVNLIDNVFTGNRSFASEGIGGGYAGPYLVGFRDGSVIQMKGNTITNNIADATMGGVMIALDSARLVVEDNYIANNYAAGIGSGLFIETTVNSEAIILDNEIRDNDASARAGLTLSNPAFAPGSTMGSLDADPILFSNEAYAYSANNLIVDNSQGLTVEGMPFYSINDTIANNQFVGISVQGVLTASVHLSNTILWGHSLPYSVTTPGQAVTANYSIIQGGLIAGTENLNADPLFVDAAGGNYRLQAGSPAVNSALTAAAPNFDLDRIARPVESVADRGAYEWHVAGVAALAPSSLPSAMPGVGTTFLFTVTNNGNNFDTFLVDVLKNELDWPVTLGLQTSSTDPFQIPLQPGESAVFEVQVTVPDGTTGGTQNELLLQVQSEQNNTVVDSASVTVIAANVAEVILSPDHSSEVASGSQASYIHTLTNQGNFTDSIGLTGVSSQGWSVVVAPAVVTLAPGASASVQVTVTVPANAGGKVDTTTVTASSSAEAGTTSASANNTTTVPRTVGLQLSAGTAQSVDPGGKVFFTHWVTNTGNAQDLIALTYTVPNGWDLDAPANVNLDAGQGRAILLEVTTPVEAAGTSGVVTVNAASTTDSAITGSAQNVADVIGIQAIQISAGTAIKTGPGTTVTFDHTVTNAGTVAAALQLSYQSANGWAVTGPTSLNLAPGQAQEIQLQVTVPADVGGQIDVTTITVTPDGNPAGTVKAQDAVIVAGAGVQLLPNNVGSVDPGATVVYSHTLINTGDATDTFNLSYASSEGWAVDGPASVEVEAGAAVVIEVAVTMPTDSVAMVDVTTVTATSQMDARQQASVTDTTYASPKRIFLPRVYKEARAAQ